MHSILKIGISRNTECVNTVGFPKLGHIYLLLSASYITVYSIKFFTALIIMYNVSWNIQFLKYFYGLIFDYATCCFFLTGALY